MPLEAITFKQTAARYPDFSENSLRWLRFNGDGNGFNTCLIKLGRRVLLIPPLFERWLETHRVAESEDWEAARAIKKPKRSRLTRPQVRA